MRAIKVFQTGGPEVLALAEIDRPQPGEGQVRVALAATGVNYIETYRRSGLYAVPLPWIPGNEGAGVVSAVGPGVTGVAVGDRVASVNLQGAYAEEALVDAQRLVAVPAGIDLAIAGAGLLQGLTAHYLVTDSYPVRAGDAILVHAAAGGTGLLVTQWAARLGARVIGTVSTAAKEELARAAGAAEVFRYGEGLDLAAAVRDVTGGEGVAAVYDGVGRDTFDASLASLRQRGILVLFGQSSGRVPPFDLLRLQDAGSLTVTRPTLAHFVTTPAELRRRADDVWRYIEDGLSIRIHERYPLAEAARAHEDLQSRRTTGKLLLVP